MGDTSQANNTTTLSSRHQHHYLSIFFAHGGVGEQLLSTHILSYLNSTELCTVSSVSKLFRSCSQVSQLWVSLLREDFSLPFSSPSLSSEFNVLLLRDATSDALSAKENYAKRLKERSWRYTQAKQAAIQAKDERKRFFRIRRIQSFLDITQFKILIPLPILALFLSIRLTCLYIDGLNVNVWVCAAPLLFYFVYLFLSMAVACCAYQQQSNAASILGGLWQDMRGPIKAVYMETLRELPRLAAYAVLILVLCTLQVILVALKLYTQQQSSAGDGSFYLAWAIVFVPLWVLFILFCMAPLLGCFGDTLSFLFMGLFLWVPFVILFVCLTIKLTAEEDHTGITIQLAHSVFFPLHTHNIPHRKDNTSSHYEITFILSILTNTPLPYDNTPSQYD